MYLDGSEAALMAAVANVGPVAVTIDATSYDFMVSRHGKVNLGLLIMFPLSFIRVEYFLGALTPH